MAGKNYDTCEEFGFMPDENPEAIPPQNSGGMAWINIITNLRGLTSQRLYASL